MSSKRRRKISKVSQKKVPRDQHPTLLRKVFDVDNFVDVHNIVTTTIPNQAKSKHRALADILRSSCVVIAMKPVH